MKRLVLLPLVWFFFMLCVKAQETGIKFVKDKTWQQILTMSGEQGKLIFLDCYTDWCGPCKAMAKDVFPLKEVGDFMNPNFINVMMDMEKGEGIDLYKRYKEYIPGFPTYLLINSKGEVVHQVAGYNAAEAFITKMNDGLNGRSWIAYGTRYEAGERDWAFLQTYLNALDNAFQTARIKEVTDNVLPTLTMEILAADSAAYWVFRKYWNTTEGDLLAAVLSSPGLYRKYSDRERDINDWGGRIYKRTVDGFVANSLLPGQFDETEAQALIEELRRLSVTGRENMVALLLMSQAVARQDGESYLRLYHAAKDFGHLRYNGTETGKWAVYLAGLTNDRDDLSQYLDALEKPEENGLFGARQYRDYAFVLDRLGESEKAAVYNKKADEAEAAMRKKLQEAGLIPKDDASAVEDEIVVIKGIYPVSPEGAAEKIYLYSVIDRNAKQFELVDSARVEEGAFALVPSGIEPGGYELRNSSGEALPIYLDFGETTVTVDSSFARSKITGNALDSLVKQYESLNMLVGFAQLGYAMKAMAYEKEGKKVPEEEVQEFVKTFGEITERKKKLTRELGSRPDLVGAYVLSHGGDSEFTTEEINGLFGAMPAAVQGAPYGRKLEAYLAKLNSLAVGVRAPDFVQANPDGDEIRLSEFISGKKLVLVDFWASWCGPCRKENPSVVALYEDYKDQGFDIIGVSLDSKKEDWLKAIADDGLTWAQVSDLGGWKNTVAGLYNVTAVPHTLLLDGNGVILAKDLRGDALRAKVEEIVGN